MATTKNKTYVRDQAEPLDVTPIVTDEPVGHLVENDLSLVAATGDPTLRPLGDYLAYSLPAATTLFGDGVNILRRNGGFEIWQRGAGGSAAFNGLVANTAPYTADGWYVYNNNNTTNVSQTNGLTSGSQFCAFVQRQSGQTGLAAMTFGFPLDTDEIWPMLGQFVRLSATLRAGPNLSSAGGIVSCILVTGTGTPVKLVSGYTGLATAISGAAAATSTATRFQFNSAAVVPVGTRQAEVVFQWTPTGTAGALDAIYVDDVQLEIVPAATGYVSTDFERLNFEEQLLLCQRHYWKSFRYAVAPVQNAGVNSGEHIAIAGKAGAAAEYLFVRNPVNMRTLPTTTLYNPAVANGQVRDKTAAADCSATAAAAITEDAFRIDTTGAAGTVVGDQLAVHLVADAGI